MTDDLARRQSIPLRRLLMHAALLATTVLTTAFAGTLWAGVVPADPLDLLRGLPYALTLLAILLTHEAGHYLMCRRHGVSATLPYVLPAPPQLFWFGTFGAVIRIRSRFPDRRALFDVGAAGPWAGFVVAVIATAVGLELSTVLPGPPKAHMLEFGDSLLTAYLTRALLHADPATVVLHPVALAGWFGLFVTSLNLIPLGQLDGGHVVYAALGPLPRIVPALLIACLVWLGIKVWPGWLLWAGISVAMVVLGHPPTVRDDHPIDTRRRIGAALSLVLFALTFVVKPLDMP